MTALICLGCGHRRAWHATRDSRCTHEIRPVNQTFTRCLCRGFEEGVGEVVQLRACPLCGSDLWPPWDPLLDPWKCTGCGAGVNVSGIEIGTITAGLAPHGRS